MPSVPIQQAFPGALQIGPVHRPANLRVLLNGQKILADGKFPGLKQPLGRGIDAEHQTTAVQQHQPLPHTAGDVLEFLGFPAQGFQLGIDLQVLPGELVQHGGQLLIGIVLQRVIQIQTIQGLHNPLGHPVAEHRGEHNGNEENHADGLQHPQQQAGRGSGGGGQPQHAAVPQTHRLVDRLFCHGRGVAHSAAAAFLKGLADLLPVQMVFHGGLIRPGVVEHPALRVHPGDPVAPGVRPLQKVKSQLLRPGGSQPQLVPQLPALHGIKIVIGDADDDRHAAQQHHQRHRQRGAENLSRHVCPPAGSPRSARFQSGLRRAQASAAGCGCACPPSGSGPGSRCPTPVPAVDPG